MKVGEDGKVYKLNKRTGKTTVISGSREVAVNPSKGNTENYILDDFQQYSFDVEEANKVIKLVKIEEAEKRENVIMGQKTGTYYYRIPLVFQNVSDRDFIEPNVDLEVFDKDGIKFTTTRAYPEVPGRDIVLRSGEKIRLITPLKPDEFKEAKDYKISKLTFKDKRTP